MSDRWEFVVVRIRDGYNTVVTVSKVECPTLDQATARVVEEFRPDLWRIGVSPESDADRG